jgi:hypothetical protein
LASAESDYNAGLAAYRGRDYRLSAQYLQRSIAEGKKGPMLLLYLGHSYTGSGDKARSVQAYTALLESFPSTPEAASGLQCLQRLDPIVARKYAATASGAQTAPVSAAGKKQAFINRIIVVEPKMGHPPVSAAMFATVRNAVQGLPTYVYRILDDHGATVNLLPNIEDKWPGSGDGMKPNEADVTMGEEAGRTYDHDVHIYERKKVRGASTLKEARGQKEILHVFYHEIGHALDDCLGLYSRNDSRLKEYFQQDLADMPADVKSQISYYTTPSEGCAELVSGILGGTENDAKTPIVMQYLPRTKIWIKDKLHI